MMKIRGLPLSISAASLGILLLASLAGERGRAQDAAPDAIAVMKAESERLRGLLPSQSHAMMDVSYHFANMWPAGQHENWPLAQFYLGETRNHIRWAIRLVPVRRTRAGELKLQERFESFDGVKLAAIQKAVDAHDRKTFSAAYRDAISGCNDCHVKADKPYLRVVVPDRPEVQGLDMNPQKGSP